MLQACSAGDGKTVSGDGGASASGGAGGLNFGSGGGDPGSGGGCASTSSEAQPGALPADIVVVVDNSGSMTDEAVEVQASMNDFANTIEASGIDAHIILISADSGDEQGVCVPTPLGSGSCPDDENLPKFRHVVTDVGSSNSFDLILSTYDQWKNSLRAGATRTIAVISDDDSSLGWASFQSQMIALDASFQDFKFDAIVAPYEVSNPLTCFGCTASMGQCLNCDPCCGADSTLGLFCTPLPADEGKEYKALVADTGGVLGDLCQQEFQPVFDDIATAVANDALLPCVYDIPDAPPGEDLDYGKVNVEYTPSPGDPPETIFFLPGGAAECDDAGGWYYDDSASPTKILLCASTCDDIQLTVDGEVTIVLGCSTQLK